MLTICFNSYFHFYAGKLIVEWWDPLLLGYWNRAAWPKIPFLHAGVMFSPFAVLWCLPWGQPWQLVSRCLGAGVTCAPLLLPTYSPEAPRGACDTQGPPSSGILEGYLEERERCHFISHSRVLLHLRLSVYASIASWKCSTENYTASFLPYF